MRRFAIRGRERTGMPPGRARVLTLAVVAATLGVVGAAVVVQRHGDGSDERRRHGHYAGTVDTGPAAPEATAGAPLDASGPTDPSAPPGTASVPAGGSSTTVAPRPGPTGTAASPATGTSGAPAKTPGAGEPPTTGRSAPGSTAPGGATATSTAPGWHVLPKAPIGGRDGHTAVWTGREMVIWGGTVDFDADPSTDGAAFDPAARTWRKVPAAPLSARFDPRAFWTGREMIVFGGTSVLGDGLGDGAAWDPGSNTWRALPASPLGPRDGAVVAWAGDRLVVWGGSTVLPPGAPPEAETEMPSDGAAYVPATDSWVRLAAAPVPGRSGAESAWTGTRLVISGGYREGDDDDRTDGVTLDPVSGRWSPITARPEPGSCDGLSCEGVWTGRGALFPVSGLLYDPAGDRWSVVAPGPEVDGPAPGEPATWTGHRLLVWGIATEGDSPGDEAGVDEETGEPSATAGAMYDPVTDGWALFPGGPLSGRERHTVVWSGEEMLVWGGGTEDGSLADGAAYRPE